MSVITLLFLVLFLFSLAANASLGFLLYKKTRKPPAVPKYDVTAQDLVHDLTTRGQAIVRIQVIDPTNILLRSPRA